MNKAYLSLLLSALPVCSFAAMDLASRTFVIFDSSGIMKGASISEGLAFEEGSLRETTAFHRALWAQSHVEQLGGGAGSPARVRLDLTLTYDGGYELQFPETCFVRYSSDGKLWSEWQAFVEQDGKPGRKVRRFAMTLAVPQEKRERFVAYLKETGDEPEHRTAKRIREKEPDFFDTQMPSRFGLKAPARRGGRSLTCVARCWI
jgi:hypothetical protein